MSNTTGSTEKRDALADVVDTYLQDTLGERFRVYKTPSHEQLNIRSQADNLSVLQNPSGEIRMLNVYWTGPLDANSAPDSNVAGNISQGNRQTGLPEQFRITLHYGYDENGLPDGRTTYDAFADLIGGVDPLGLARYLNVSPAIETDDGDPLILSRVQNYVVPPVPRPLTRQNSGARAHFAQFDVTLTDN